MPHSRLLLALFVITGCSTAASEGIGSLPAAVSNAGGAAALPPPTIRLPYLHCPMGQAQARALEDGRSEQWCLRGTKIHGPFRQFHPNGNKAVTGSFENGRKSGAWQWWHVTGARLTKGQYRQDKPSGVWNWWHPNGKTQESGDHLGGKRAGYWQTWHPNGKRAAEGEYVNGKKEGEWAVYDNFGKLKERQQFRRGELL